MKPRLCRSCWRAFGSTHPFMLPSSLKEALLACPPSPPWNLSSFTVESIVSSPCSHSDFLSRQGAALAHLDSPPSSIWCFQRTALFFFLLARAALTYLPTSLSMASRPPFPFQQAQVYAQVFPLKLAPFCKLFAGLGSTIKSAISLFFSSYLTLALSSSPYSLPHLSFSQSLWQQPSSLSSCSIRLHWVPGYSYLLGNDAADELARRGALLVPSAIPCSLSPLISRIHSFLSWSGGVLSQLNFLTHRFPRFPLKNLCSFATPS